MEKELLSWIGNFINFLIVIYLIRATVFSGAFNFQQTLITVFGLFISVIIQLYNVKR